MQAIANLAVFAGIRKDIEAMPEAEQSVLTEMLLAMDRYDLYGKMAIPKNHDSEFDVPELYRLAASSRGIFVNTAFTELFGLTAIESSAVGLPFVVTSNGGPRDIVENCQSGLIVDVTQPTQLTDAMMKMLTDRRAWDRASTNGINLVRKHYSWKTHCERYRDVIKDLPAVPRSTVTGGSAPGRRFASLERILITDIDNTLIGDEQALERLRAVLADNRDRLGFGVASGRAPALVYDILDQHGIADLDVVIASVGSEIYYGPKREPDQGWASQLQSKWRPEAIRATLDQIPDLVLQSGEHTQRQFKISYLIDPRAAEHLIPTIKDRLASRKISCSLIHSHGTFVDILPHRASKGKAIHYLADKWNIPLNYIATAGDSGNDRDMLTGKTAGIVVGNHSEELSPLRNAKNTGLYFADGHFADGILEGLQHYGFIERWPENGSISDNHYGESTAAAAP